MTERTILCFGDSNTHGSRPMRHFGDRRRYAPQDRWPNVMGATLGPGWTVLAEGHPGRTGVFDDPVEGAHKNGLRALPVLLESHRPLDLVIVMLGTNDLKARFAVPASDIAIGLERVVAEILRSDAGPTGTPPQVLLASPVPVEEIGFLGEMFAGGAARSRALPPLLQEVAVRQAVPFIDLAGVAEVDPVDGIHLSLNGHAAVGKAMAAAVQGMFAESEQDMTGERKC